MLKQPTMKTSKNFARNFLKKTLKEQITDLTQRIATLTSENESFLKRTFEITEDISNLTAIISALHKLPDLQRMFLYHNQQLPLTTDSNTAPHHLFFHVLECAPSSSQETLKEILRCPLQQLPPDRNPTVPPTTSQYVPMVTFAKNTLLNKNLRPIYRCCGVPSVARYKNVLRTGS